MSERRYESQDLLVARIGRAAAEVVSYEELGHEVLPALQRLLGASSLQLYRSEPRLPIVSVIGSGALRELSSVYVERFIHDDPLQASVRRADSPVLNLARSTDWRRYVKLPVHRFWSRQEVDELMLLRLHEGQHFTPGMAAIVVSRPPRRSFSGDDEILAAQIMPALQAAARRCRRSGQATFTLRALEQLLEDRDPRPRLVLDLGGKVVWLSARAASWLGDAALPGALQQAARKLAAAASRRRTPPQLAVDLSGPDGARYRAELRLVRGTVGEALVVIELAPQGISSAVALAARRFALTRAETQVLGHLASGLRDLEIAERTCTSLYTIRTHVSRILGKLGVRSRLEAALLARGSGSAS